MTNGQILNRIPERKKIVQMIDRLPKDIMDKMMGDIKKEDLSLLTDVDLFTITVYGWGIHSITKNMDKTNQKISYQENHLSDFQSKWNIWKQENISDAEINVRELLNSIVDIDDDEVIERKSISTSEDYDMGNEPNDIDDLLDDGYEEYDGDEDYEDEISASSGFVEIFFADEPDAEPLTLPVSLVAEAIGMHNIPKLFLLRKKEILVMSNYISQISGMMFAVTMLKRQYSDYATSLMDINNRWISWRETNLLEKIRKVIENENITEIA